MSEAKHKLQDCEHNEGYCADETCVGKVDNCRIGDKDAIIAELMEACEAVVPYLGTGHTSAWGKVSQKIRQALTKAKGES